MKIGKHIFLSVAVFLLMNCSTVPLTGRKQFTAISSSQMNSLGETSYNQVISESKLSANKEYINRVTRVGKRLSAAVEQYLKQNRMSSYIEGYTWEFNVLQSDQLNAWCMPGGKIAFYEGIIPVCLDDEGIAVVMSHEIAHAIAQHGNERMSQQLVVQMGGVALYTALAEQPETTQELALAAFGVGSAVGILLPYSRKHESEADEMGLYFMAMAGYNPKAAPEFWERMLKAGKGSTPEFLSTHPDPENRIKRLNTIMPKAMEYYKPQ
ncbi:MAG: M48 family metallopeptidase [Bacteroidales bacterium]|jgi:predicted Zn-dependent protease